MMSLKLVKLTKTYEKQLGESFNVCGRAEM